MADILITDDHPFFRMGLQLMLETEGHKVVGAFGDALSAKAAIKTTKPDIILLDIRMSGPNGIQMLQELRSKGNTLPVIILAVEITEPHLLAAFQAGVNGIVFKHENESRILDAIETVMRGGRFIEGSLLDQAFSLAAKGPGTSPLDALTEKESEIARLVADGLKNREIAERVSTTEGTIKAHLHRIYAKCDVANRAELASAIAQAER